LDIYKDFMLKTLKQHWHIFKKAPTGQRFERYYESRHNTPRGLVKKILLISMGAVVVLVGIFFLAVPGPGLVVLLIGAILIARESLFVSRLFDRIEPRVSALAIRCRRIWQRLPIGVKILLTVTVAALTAAVCWFAYRIILAP
jgi:hypothetical protein